jgi:NADPH-dependent 2,4-dienoyl-CoA reductase/sulfur reductase-like enzyme
MSHPLRLVIVGGVAAGASAAARARRLSETTEIILIERGADVSFANCGLPYHIGGEIAERAALAMQTPQTLKALLNLDVRTGTEVVAIDRAGKRVQLRTLATAAEAWLPYDKLVLAPGAVPLRPPLPGVDDPRLHTLRSLQDMDRIKAAAAIASRVCVIGAGFIGLEMAEQFVHLKKTVTLVELLDQLLPPLDKPMTLLMEDELKRHGVELALGDAIAGFSPTGEGLECQLKSGRVIPSDLVVLAIGVRPDTALAKAAGIELGPRGHIRVDTFLRTNDPDIYAAGDAVEVRDLVTGDPSAVPLGGPANRQGRAAADHIFRPDKAKPFPWRSGYGNRARLRCCCRPHRLVRKTPSCRRPCLLHGYG